MKLRIMESKKLSNEDKSVFDRIAKALERIGFTLELDTYDTYGSVNILDVVASNDSCEFVSMQIVTIDGAYAEEHNSEKFSVVFKHNMKYAEKKRFNSIDDMVSYIIKVVSNDQAVRTQYDTGNIKQRKSLLCQDCIDSLRGFSGKRVTVLKDGTIPQRRISVSDNGYTSGEEVCKCDRCKNMYPVDWIHVCTIN